MTFYRVTNTLKTSLVIEDLGLILAAGENRLITADAYSRSEDIRRQTQHLKIDTVYMAGKIFPAAVHSVAPVITPPVTITPNIAPVPPSDFVEVIKKVDGIYDMLRTLTSQNQTINTKDATDIQKSIQTLEEPMFIPSSIVPTNTNISTKTVEVSVDKDIGDSKESLKRLRKKP